jgi:hypothetical protein
VCKIGLNSWLEFKLGRNWLYIIFRRIVLKAANLAVMNRLLFTDNRLSEIWQELAPHYFLQIVLDGGSRFSGDGQTIFTDRRLSEIWRELALHYFWAECFGGSRLGGDGQIVMTFRQLSQIWRELALHYFPVDCFGGIRFGGDRQTIFTDSRLSEIWQELAPHFFWVDCFGFFSDIKIFLALVLGTN